MLSFFHGGAQQRYLPRSVTYTRFSSIHVMHARCLSVSLSHLCVASSRSLKTLFGTPARYEIVILCIGCPDFLAASCILRHNVGTDAL
jgi:hypothetical protein